MSFKIKDGVRVGTVDVFNSAGALLVNAPTATKLAATHTLSMTGDVVYTSPAIDGSGNVTAAATLSNTGATAGSWGHPPPFPSCKWT